MCTLEESILLNLAWFHFWRHSVYAVKILVVHRHAFKAYKECVLRRARFVGVPQRMSYNGSVYNNNDNKEFGRVEC